MGFIQRHFTQLISPLRKRTQAGNNSKCKSKPCVRRPNIHTNTHIVAVFHVGNDATNPLPEVHTLERCLQSEEESSMVFDRVGICENQQACTSHMKEDHYTLLNIRHIWSLKGQILHPWSHRLSEKIGTRSWHLEYYGIWQCYKMTLRKMDAYGNDNSYVAKLIFLSILLENAQRI